MDYRKFGQTIILRLDRGEEILEQLKAVGQAEGIKLASINGLGAVGAFTVGVFDPEKKQYFSNQFQGLYEIVSLHGTISTFHGEYYSHLHMSAGDREGRVFGGHLNRAVISATCEIIITLIDGTVDRRYEESLGLNLFDFR